MAFGNLSSFFLNDTSTSSFWATFFLGKSFALILASGGLG
jgi:hypothetical protein